MVGLTDCPASSLWIHITGVPDFLAMGTRFKDDTRNPAENLITGVLWVTVLLCSRGTRRNFNCFTGLTTLTAW
ncbi:hypothetical protein N7468_009320 [Penicillium chermesinum]|uniref:Uncharacterized protein n=1 Tax=Penicillium chermesinum TaxID=63820 RepID=A0A9W9TEV6_9EURO|nr:uncharacterized protein N7468_009320 [Penicillium chermesinum]KAJ5220116.1 hypothetical protein N7468_009320 [Penicillium chermesinum]